MQGPLKLASRRLWSNIESQNIDNPNPSLCTILKKIPLTELLCDLRSLFFILFHFLHHLLLDSIFETFLFEFIASFLIRIFI